MTNFTKDMLLLEGTKNVLHAQFHELYTKLWLFEPLFTNAMLTKVQIWDRLLNYHITFGHTYDGWRSPERP